MEIIKVNNEIFAFNKVWYISPDGSDLTGNGTKENPLATIPRARQVSTAGDALYLLEGTHILDITTRTNETFFYMEASKPFTLFGTPYKSKIYIDGAGYSISSTNGQRFYALGAGANTSWYQVHLEIDNAYYSVNYANCLFSWVTAHFYNCLFVCKTNLGCHYYNSQPQQTEPHYINCSIYYVNQQGSNCSGKPNTLNTDTIYVDNLPGIVSHCVQRPNQTIAYVDVGDFIREVPIDCINKGLNYNGTTNLDGSQTHVGIMGGPYAWLSTTHKYFIFHNNQYKIYNKDSSIWSTPQLASYMPTKEEYLELGMDDIPSTNLQELLNNKRITMYIDDNTAIEQIVTIKPIVKPTMVTSNNIILSDVHEVQSITLTATNENTSTIKMAVSSTNGNEWFMYRDNEWHISNNIKEDGNTIEEFNTINEAFNAILNINDKKLMFKFYMSLNNINDKLEVDKLSYTVDLKGVFEKVIDTKYRQLYTTNSTVKLELFEDGVYKINY